ncbi:Hsp20/alpha crystallin family protein [Motiliproteus sp. SC1-56]|uniref:Hsp20/alpha crystallin family protein n=1 Tax=Motiliproteus sp. SC1-56 TaxID=2799565 RepID=UPI001A8D7D4E|nr:Hsp20/alpha crystallin family protein [Motiliproteus sp. SC1-56]
MSNLTRFNRMFGDTFFDDFFRPLTQSATEKLPAIDVLESDESYIIKTDLPGVRKEDIEVKLENGVLSIRAETHKEDEEKQAGKLIRQERHYGSFLRQMSVGPDVDPDAVKAQFSDGLLTLTLPKQPEQPARGVNIDVR